MATKTAGIKVIAQNYHRNGVGGDGFVTSIVDWPEAIADSDGEASGQFVAVSFFLPEFAGRTPTPKEREEYFRAHTAVLNINDLVAGIVDHGFRGADRVGPTVAKAWHDFNVEGGAFGFKYDPWSCGHAPGDE